MPELGSLGSVRGALSNEGPYREQHTGRREPPGHIVRFPENRWRADWGAKREARPERPSRSARARLAPVHKAVIEMGHCL